LKREWLMVTRRNFLIALPVFAVSAGAFAISPFRRRKLIPVAPAFVYLGTDTGKGKSKGIYQSRFDSVTGRLTPPVLAAAIPTPISLALSPPRNGRRFLYSANSTSPSSAAATTFAIDPTTAALRQIGQVAISGSDPACISIDDTGRVAFVASFDSSVSSFRVLPRMRNRMPRIRTRSQYPLTTASCSSLTSAPIASQSSSSIPRLAISLSLTCLPTTAPAPVRAVSYFTPMAAGSMESTNLTRLSIATFGPPPASARLRRDFW